MLAGRCVTIFWARDFPILSSPQRIHQNITIHGCHGNLNKEKEKKCFLLTHERERNAKICWRPASSWSWRCILELIVDKKVTAILTTYIHFIAVHHPFALVTCLTNCSLLLAQKTQTCFYYLSALLQLHQRCCQGFSLKNKHG